jgi:hypothetical protein
LNVVVQLLPGGAPRRRQSADNDIRSRLYCGQQLKRNRLEAAPNEITPHSITHILCDDETESNRVNDIGFTGV